MHRMDGAAWLNVLVPAFTSGAALLFSWSEAVRWLPFLGLLRGPLGVVLLALGLGVSLARVARFRTSGRGFQDPPRWMLFIAAACLFLSLGLRYAAHIQATGDEPHYLLMAQSLWREGDLDLRDNLARGDYLEYTPGPLAPHWGAPRPDGRPFPAHSPGLPALLAPVYALGGRQACVVALALAAVLLTTQTYSLARRAVGGEAAVVAWTASLGAPVFFYAFNIYTEVPSALALVLSLRLLLSSPPPGRAAWAGLAASALPWLHVKMVPAAAVLGGIALWRLRGRSRLAFVATAASMALAFLGYYQWIYGRPTPLALYGSFPPEARRSPWTATAGLLLDRSFGLLPHAPVFLLGLAGLPALLRRGEGLALAVLGSVILAPVLAWRMWWGGLCPPSRFLVPLVPLLSLAAATRVGRAPYRGLSRWRWTLVGLGLALACYMCSERLLLNRRDRPTEVWEALAGTVSPGRYLPSLVSGAGAEWSVALLWGCVLGLLLVLDAIARRRETVDRLFGGLGFPLALLALTGAAIDVWLRPPPVG